MTVGDVVFGEKPRSSMCSGMSQRETFQATVAHRAHKGCLFRAEFTPALDQGLRERLGVGPEVNLQQFFGMFDPVWVMPTAPAGYAAPDYSQYFTDIEVPPGSTIDHVGCLHIPGSQYHFTRYVSPLRNAQTLADLESFPYPDVSGFDTSQMAEKVRAAHEQGKVAATPVGHIFEDSWQIRGIEPFLMDMAAQPEWAEYVLDKIMARNMARAVAGAKAGADLLLTADDVATQTSMMFSVEQWRYFIKSRWEKIYSAARTIKPDIEIAYHSDGKIEPILPELIEIGVTILNPVQPECLDLLETKRVYGDRLVFEGTIGTQTTMPFGTPDEVRGLVRRRAETLGKDGALILCPTHVLEPDVPVDNVLAFVETCQELAA